MKTLKNIVSFQIVFRKCPKQNAILTISHHLEGKDDGGRGKKLRTPLLRMQGTSSDEQVFVIVIVFVFVFVFAARHVIR